MKTNFSPFPLIETPNLVLRRMEDGDLEDVFEMRSDPRMHLHTDTKPDEAPAETAAYIEKMTRGVDTEKWIIWAIQLRQSPKVIGSVSIWNLDRERGSGELGYGITPAYQGKGFMKEALRAAIDYGFNIMDLKTLEAYTERANTASCGLLERCGFTEADRVDEEGACNKRTYHMVVYRLTA